jgi:hypothetical protein
MTTFAYDNIITRNTTTLSLNTGDENASYPLTNIQKIHVTKTYRSVSGTSSVKILIDAGEPVAADAVFLKSADGFGLSSLTINGNTGDAWGSPPFTQAISTLNDTYNLGYELFSSTQTYRYWLLEAEGSGSYVELANVFLGPVVQNFDSQELRQGWTHVNRDTSIARKAYSGQRYIDERPEIAELEASLMDLDETETSAIDAMFEYAGKRKPVWLLLTIDTPLKYSGQYFFKEKPAWTQDRYRLHSTKLSFEEAK